MKTSHNFFSNLAFNLAESHIGKTATNPSVGCIVVKNHSVISSGVTSIQVNEVMPYVQSGQMVGVLAGMPGAAEYESLIGQKGSATSGMDAQSVAHLVIVHFIVLGNISYFIDRKRSRKY